MSDYGNMSRAMAGQSVDSGFDSYNESGKVCEGTPIQFGIATFKGSNASRVKIATATTDKFRGFAVKVNNGKGQYDPTDPVTYKRKGRIFAQVMETGISADDDVYVNMADPQRRLCNDSNGGANIKLPAVFRSADNEDGLAEVEVNIP